MKITLAEKVPPFYQCLWPSVQSERNKGLQRNILDIVEDLASVMQMTSGHSKQKSLGLRSDTSKSILK